MLQNLSDLDFEIQGHSKSLNVTKVTVRALKYVFVRVCLTRAINMSAIYISIGVINTAVINIRVTHINAINMLR